MTPPRLARDHGAQVAQLLSQGLKIRGMGKEALREFMRLMLINVADVLDDELSDDMLKGILAFDTVLGHHAGPRSPNSLLSLYNRISANQGALALPQGGMSSVVDAMQRSISAAGVVIRCNAPAAKIDVQQDRAKSVLLASGETLKADIIVTALHPQATLLSLVGAPNLETGFVRRVRNIKSRGTTAHLHLTLSGKPEFRGANIASRLVIAPSIHAVEDAFNAVKYGAFSEEPVMECIVPTAFEQPEGQTHRHVLTALVQFAPHDLRQGWTRGKPAFLKRIMRQLERYAPGIGKQVIQSRLLTPADIAKRYGSPGGQWHHAELSVEQMFFLRPAIGLAQHGTPIGGLFQASAAMHPGGGVNGSAGWNAATQALKAAGVK
jgi:phytoene dehydrogenase-like protein